MRRQKKLIERAYHLEPQQGMQVWCTDQAGPFQTMPYPGQSWQPQAHAARQRPTYLRNGTAKLLTLFHPQTGHVHVKGVTRCPNTVLHGWLEQELAAIIAGLPPPAPVTDATANATQWASWQRGLKQPVTLPTELPPLRLLLILDNLAGHRTPRFVRWLVQHGIMPLYTPLGGSWLNMAESIQRILKRRAIAGQHPTMASEIIAWLEASARGWNADPTPFIWGGKRAARRARSWQRRHALGGSGACTKQPIRRQTAKWRWT